MARSPHDPVYTLGWIIFLTVLGIIVLAYQGKDVPPLLGAVLGSAMTALAQAARVYVDSRRIKPRPKPRRKPE